MEPMPSPPPRAKILIADSDGAFRQSLIDTLRGQGYGVEPCVDGQSVRQRLGESAIDLILLSGDLPPEGGWPLLAELRQGGGLPVIFLSEYRACCIDAFRRGADDFVLKPCDSLELALRCDALLRRVSRRPAPEAVTDDLVVGPLVLCRADRSALYNGQTLTLTAVQFKLLWRLGLCHNQVLSKAYLHERVLDKSYCRDDRSIDMHLSRVRKKLLGAGMPPDALQTIRGRGYRLALVPDHDLTPNHDLNSSHEFRENV